MRFAFEVGPEVEVLRLHLGCPGRGWVCIEVWCEGQSGGWV